MVVDNASSEAGQPWVHLAEQIRGGDEEAFETLYRYCNRSVRSYLRQHVVHQVLDDAVHQTFLATLAILKNAETRDCPELPGLVDTMARRLVSGMNLGIADSSLRALLTERETLLAASFVDRITAEQKSRLAEIEKDLEVVESNESDARDLGYPQSRMGRIEAGLERLQSVMNTSHF
ncbi:MAG: hypothetical protein FJW39_11160 [Acidobacteria bacterium]|nr:hypothetical protein [Acidobacteriota bacterium]